MVLVFGTSVFGNTGNQCCWNDYYYAIGFLSVVLLAYSTKCTPPSEKIFWQLVRAVGRSAWEEGLGLVLTGNENAAVSYVLDIEPSY